MANKKKKKSYSTQRFFVKFACFINRSSKLIRNSIRNLRFVLFGNLGESLEYGRMWFCLWMMQPDY